MNTTHSSPPPQPRFATMFDFVDQLILPLYGTTVMQQREVNWSKKWWAHPEAIVRLNGLWKTFEKLRIEAPAVHMELFLRVHADYHMHHLMAADGVFAQCRREDQETIPLPTEPIPTQK